MNLSEPFIRRPVMTVLLTLAAVAFGVLCYVLMPVSDLPSVDYPVIQVSVAYPGATPETMANNVATPLERQFLQIPGLELITSNSGQGNSSFVLQFDLSKNIDGAATDVQAAITRASGQLPVDLPSPPTFTKTNPNDQPQMYLAVMSDTQTEAQLYDYASTQVGQRISIIPGVSQVQEFGTPSAVRIKADPGRLATRGLTMDDLNSAILANTSYQGAGQFDGPSRSLLLQPQGQLGAAAEYNDMIVGQFKGSPVHLRDVARAVDSVQDERQHPSFWFRKFKQVPDPDHPGKMVDKGGAPSAIVVVPIYRAAGANAVQVSKLIEAELPNIQKTLPPSVALRVIYDKAKTIEDSFHDVEETLIIAFVLVVLVIFVFLGRAADTIIPAVALPLSLLLTFVGMEMLGYSLDNLSLMALTLAIGFLVDDAIVFLENAVRRMEKFGEPPLLAALRGAQEISFTILSMTVSLAAVFIPLVFLSGLMGRIFREFSITIVIAIFVSGIVSLSLTPLMCARMLSARGHGERKTFLERVIGGIEHRVLGVYGSSLWFFLRHKWISALVWVLCLAGTIYLFDVVPKAFLPAGDSSFLFGVMIAQQGSSPAQMQAYQAQVERVLQANPDVEITITATGLTGMLNSNQGIVIAFLNDPKDRTTKPAPGEKTASIQTVSGSLMGNIFMQTQGLLTVLPPQPVLQISTGATARNTGPVSFSISGTDPQEVYATGFRLMGAFAKQLGHLLAPQGGMVPDMYLQTPNVQIEPLRDQAATYGVTTTRIETLLRNAYSQNYSYLIKRPNNQYQVILEVEDNGRTEPVDLSKLYIKSDDGLRTVPLDAVAKWHESIGPQAVNHINQFTSVTFGFTPAPGVALGDVTNFIQKTSDEIVPKTMKATFQGEALTFRSTVSDLTVLMIVAVFVMYIILGILYESYVHPITVLSSLPVALLGGLATLMLFGAEASLYAYIGMFMLMGIVKKNGIMIVDFALQRIAAGETAERAIHDASMDRFRPILMTTLAAVMGAVPIALGFGADGSSRRPLGLVIVGGLIVSQFITLYVTPAIYLYLEQFQENVLDRTSFFRSTRAHHDEMDEMVRQANGQPVTVADGPGIDRGVPVLAAHDERGNGH